MASHPFSQHLVTSMNIARFARHFSIPRLFIKIGGLIGRHGLRMLLLQILTLYYVMIDPKTPLSVRASIVGALGYFILPIDIFPDWLPGGFLDDAAVLTWVTAHIRAHIDERHKEAAVARLELMWKKGPDKA